MLATGVVVENCLCSGCFGLKDGPVGNVAIPFYQRRDRPPPANDDVVELPDGVGDRAVVAVDEQELSLVVRLLGMSRKVNLADVLHGIVLEIIERRIPVIGRRDEDVI